MCNAGSTSKGNRQPRPETDAVGIVRKRYMQPTATHVEALKENFLDGEFDPPPSPPELTARDESVAGGSFVGDGGQISMPISRVRTRQTSSEERSVCIEGELISYSLQRSRRRRRTIQLQVDAESGFKLMVPHTMTEPEIEEFLLKRSKWILKHRPDQDDVGEVVDWSTGGAAMYRGRRVELIVGERDSGDPGRDLPPTVAKSLEGDQIAVTIPPNMNDGRKGEVVRELMTSWFRQEAWDHLSARIVEFGTLMGVQPRQLKLSNAKRRWGSCSAKQSINLNWRLILLDDCLIDYVVVHELAHLVELNHSADFWRVVEGVIPNHRELRRRLREQSPSAFG